MTKRVIQTDLFAAFKESQKQAEEQYGHKKSIHVEGTGLRQTSDTTTSRGQGGYEVIVTKPVEAKPETPTAGSAAPTAKPLTIEPPRPQQTTRAPLPQLTSVKSPADNIPETTPEPAVKVSAPSAQAPVASPKPVSRPRVTARKAPQRVVRRTPDRVVPSKPVTRTQEPTPVQKTEQQVTPPVQETVSENTPQPQPAAPAPVQAASNSGNNLLKVATVIVMMLAVYAWAKRPVTPPPTTDTTPTTEARPSSDTAASTTDSSAAQQPAVVVDEAEGTNPVEAIEDAQSGNTESETPAVIPTPVTRQGNMTVLLISGINKRTAEDVAAFVRTQIQADVYVHNNAVYVGRFESATCDEIRQVIKNCQNLVYNNRKDDFRGAMAFPLPKALRN